MAHVTTAWILSRSLLLQDADIVCAVVVAIQLFASSAAKRGAGRILVISDGLTTPALGKDTLDQSIRDKITAQGLTVDIFAVGNWGNSSGLPDSAADADVSVTKARPESLGFRPLLIQLAEVTGGRVDTLASAQAVMGALRSRTVLQRSKYRVDLDIGSGGVRIPIYGYSFTSEAKAESLKKTTVRAATRASASDGTVEDEDPFADGSGGGGRSAKDVTYERGYVRAPAADAATGDGAADVDEPAPITAAVAAAMEFLSAEKLSKAFKYGSSYVIPVSETVSWKLLSGERSFKVLGGLHRKHFPFSFANSQSPSFVVQVSSVPTLLGGMRCLAQLTS
jgi:hypothetical protein